MSFVVTRQKFNKLKEEEKKKKIQDSKQRKCGMNFQQTCVHSVVIDHAKINGNCSRVILLTFSLAIIFLVLRMWFLSLKSEQHAYLYFLAHFESHNVHINSVLKN